MNVVQVWYVAIDLVDEKKICRCRKRKVHDGARNPRAESYEGWGLENIWRMLMLC